MYCGIESNVIIIIPWRAFEFYLQEMNQFTIKSDIQTTRLLFKRTYIEAAEVDFLAQIQRQNDDLFRDELHCQCFAGYQMLDFFRLTRVDFHRWRTSFETT